MFHPGFLGSLKSHQKLHLKPRDQVDQVLGGPMASPQKHLCQNHQLSADQRVSLFGLGGLSTLPRGTKPPSRLRARARSPLACHVRGVRCLRWLHHSEAREAIRGQMPEFSAQQAEQAEQLIN